MSLFSAFKSILSKVATTIVTKEILDVIRALPAKVKSWWRGKKIAAIGPTAAGKNSFYQKLKRESIPSEHYQTRGAEEVESFKFRQALPDSDALEFECKRAINVGGETDERERYWLQACNDADVIFYIVDVQRLLEDGTGEDARVYADLKWLATHLPHMHDNVLVHILVNKIDLLLPEHKDLKAIGKHLKNAIQALEVTRDALFGTYSKRVTGITPISMQDDHMFNIGFGAALTAVHKALR